MNEFLELRWQQNTLAQWAIALATFLAVVLVARFVRDFTLRRLRALAARTENPVDDLIVVILERTKTWFLVLLGLAIATAPLTLGRDGPRIVRIVMTFAVMVQVAIIANRIVKFFVDRYVLRRGPDTTGIATIRGFAFLARVAVGLILLVAALDVVGVKVTTFIAGLGITGIAVALAVQSVLADLFAALSIVLDKPFVVGDFIVMDNVEGTVERVGLKTTRIRALGGEQVIVANAELLRGRIRNYRRLSERRVVLKVMLAQDTLPAKAARFPEILQEIVVSKTPVRFDRAHLLRIADVGLEFELVYFVNSPDYVVHMNVLQSVNLELLERMRREELTLAQPTRLIHAPPAASIPAGVGTRQLIEG
jgi:small-conductance mechanosensitive channel